LNLVKHFLPYSSTRKEGHATLFFRSGALSETAHPCRKLCAAFETALALNRRLLLPAFDLDSPFLILTLHTA